MPPFRAVTSGLLSGDKLFGEFDAWNNARIYKSVPILFDSVDFLTGVGNEGEWFWRVDDDVTEADVAPYKIVEQPALAGSLQGHAGVFTESSPYGTFL